MLFALVLVALAAGLAGAMNGATAVLLGDLLAEWGSLIAVIVSWVPTIALYFLTGLALCYIIQRALARVRGVSRLLAVAVGLAAAFIAAYGLLEGEALYQYAAEAVHGTLDPKPALWQAGWLLGGGLLRSATIKTTSDVIYICLAGIAAVYYGVAGIGAATQVTSWQQRLAAVADGDPLAGPDQPAAAPRRALPGARAQGWLGGLLIAGLVPAVGLILLGAVLVGATESSHEPGPSTEDAPAVLLPAPTSSAAAWATGVVVRATDGSADAAEQLGIA
jgi:hypothetical protein